MKPPPRFELSEDFISVAPMGGLSGWIRKGLPDDLLADFIRDPEPLCHEPSSTLIKRGSKSRIVRLTLPVAKGESVAVIVKRVRFGPAWRRAGFFFVSSPALRSLKNALALMARGIDTPPPLAAFEYRDWKRLGTSYYLVEEIEGSQTLPLLWLNISPRGSNTGKRKEKRGMLRSLAAFFHRLHSRGVYHQDLKGGNILVRKRGSETWQYYLIDIDGVWTRKRLSWFRRIKNLVQLYRTFGEHLTIKEKVRFLKDYTDCFLLSRERRKAVATEILSMNSRWDHGLVRQWFHWGLRRGL